VQVQLIVANENHAGRVIPVNVPSFMIGRAEGCNLRSQSPLISRHHCVIQINNDVVTVSDLGGGNGTFVNGNQITSVQTLKDGDKLAVGQHVFTVSVSAGGKPLANHGDFFELTPPPVTQEAAKQEVEKKDREYFGPETEMIAIMPTNTSKLEDDVKFEIRLDGQRVTVTKSRLFDLARKGSISPDDLVTVAGTKVFADSIQGIVFGDKPPAAPPPPRVSPQVSPQVAAPASSSVRSPAKPAASAPPAATTAAAKPPAPVAPAGATPTASDPLAFPDMGGVADDSSPFNVSSEPFVRIARRESAFKSLWSALDISFSRVYTLEGNILAIHSIKALYYIIVLICVLCIFFFVTDLCANCYKSEDPLAVLRNQYVGLAFVTFGCAMIIVIVRVLIEMLLLAWLESAREEQDQEKQ
jgi:hypothetical protein